MSYPKDRDLVDVLKYCVVIYSCLLFMYSGICLIFYILLQICLPSYIIGIFMIFLSEYILLKDIRTNGFISREFVGLSGTFCFVAISIFLLHYFENIVGYYLLYSLMICSCGFIVFLLIGVCALLLLLDR